MRLLSWCKDGGPESTVSAFWLLEIKSLFSVGLLRFGHGSRSSYHTHAFNSWSWLLSGQLLETSYYDNEPQRVYTPSWRWIKTAREVFHRVASWGNSWVFTLRGPWRKYWYEYNPEAGQWTSLTHGRKEVGRVLAGRPLEQE